MCLLGSSIKREIIKFLCWKTNQRTRDMKRTTVARIFEGFESRLSLEEKVRHFENIGKEKKDLWDTLSSRDPFPLRSPSVPPCLDSICRQIQAN